MTAALTTGFDPRSALRSAGWFTAVGVALSATKLVTGVGFPCPWRAVTGTLCPFCGATTMGTHLLRGDIVAAWHSNPFVFALLVLGGLAIVVWSVEAIGGPALRPPRRLRSARFWWTVLGVVAVSFAVLRNLG